MKFKCRQKASSGRARKEGGQQGGMSIIDAAIDAIARRCRGSTRQTRAGCNAQAEPVQAPARKGTQTPATSSMSGVYQDFPYFEFSCYHASGLCLIGGEGH